MATIDIVGVKYTADVASLQAALEEQIKLNHRLQSEIDKTGEKQRKTSKNMVDGFVSGSEGMKRYQAEITRTVKTQGDLDSKINNMRQLLKDDTKIGSQAYKTLQKEIAKAEKEQAKLTASTQTLGQKLGGIPGPVGQVVQSVQGMGKALMLIVANPIVLTITAIVAGLALVYKWFKSTDEGGTQLAGVFSAISTGVNVLVQNVGNLLNAAKLLATGNFKEAGNIIKGVGTQMRDAALAANRYELALDALQDTWTTFTTDIALNANKIAQLEFKAADKTLGNEERKAALEEAIKISEDELLFRKQHANDLLTIEIDKVAAEKKVSSNILREYVTSGKKRAAALLEMYPSLKAARNNMEEEEKTLRGLYSNVLETETNFFNENKRNQSKRSGFMDQISNEAIEKRKKAEEIILAAEKQRLQNEMTLQDLRISNMEDGLGKELAARDLAYARAREQFKGQADILLELERQYDLDIEKIAKKHQDPAIEERKKKEAEIKTIIETARRDANMARMTSQEKELFELEEFYKAKLLLVAGNEEAIALLTDEWEAKKVVVAKTYKGKEITAQQETNDAKLQLAQDLSTASLQIGESLIQDQAKLAEFQKTMALFQIGLDTAVAISGVVRAASSTSLTPIDQAIKVAAGIAVVLVNIAKAKALLTEPPAFKDGVIDLQGPGTETSDSIVARLSRRESVMTAKETKSYKDELTAMRNGNYEDLILSKYVMPILRAERAAQNVASNNQRMIQAAVFDDDRIVSGLRKIKPATAKDIEGLGIRIERTWKDSAFKSSKKWQA